MHKTTPLSEGQKEKIRQLWRAKPTATDSQILGMLKDPKITVSQVSGTLRNLRREAAGKTKSKASKQATAVAGNGDRKPLCPEFIELTLCMLSAINEFGVQSVRFHLDRIVDSQSI